MRTLILGALLVLSLGSFVRAESAPTTSTATPTPTAAATPTDTATNKGGVWDKFGGSGLGGLIGAGVGSLLTQYFSKKRFDKEVAIMQEHHSGNLIAPFSLALNQKRLDACLDLCRETITLVDSIRRLHSWEKITHSENWEGEAFEGVRKNNRHKSVELGKATVRNGIELLRVWGKYVPLFSKEFNRCIAKFHKATLVVKDIAQNNEPDKAMASIDAAYAEFMLEMETEMNRKIEFRGLAEKNALLPKVKE